MKEPEAGQPGDSPYERFQRLARHVLSVPRKDIEKKLKKGNGKTQKPKPRKA